MIEDFYFWIFRQVMVRRRPTWFWIWAWRRFIMVREVCKHVKRRNPRQALIYLRMLV